MKDDNDGDEASVESPAKPTRTGNETLSSIRESIPKTGLAVPEHSKGGGQGGQGGGFKGGHGKRMPKSK